MPRIAPSLFVVVLAVGGFQLYNKFFPNEPCSQDPPIRLVRGESNTEYSWEACEVFSLEYHDARHKFRKAARRLKTTAASVPVVLNDGSNDSPLTTDIAILPGKLPGVLAHSSATHGIEGYAGSAIQLALMQEGVLPSPENRPTVVFVHAVNPNGMKNYRRFNEHNVDLNRNGIPNFPEFLDQRDPNIAHYDDFVDLTAPQRKPVYWWDGIFGFWFSFAPALLQHGYEALKHVLVAGQYHHPEGIFYGGTQLEPSIQGLLDLLQEDGRNILNGNGGRLAWIDVHTGLGPFGMDTVMTQEPVETSAFREYFPTAYDLLTPQAEARGALSGYGNSCGMLPSLFYEITNNSALTLTQEFGTIPGVLVARALILENMMYHHGEKEQRDTIGRSMIQAAFYPQSTEWRSSVVTRGVSLALETLEFLVKTTNQQAEETPAED
eukprot:Nitzschia sp. Nitz4//scaffold24_size164493//71066//72373//NITZ4_002326-RA/size164493-processed-gene-0.197-mRNA-1//1//CDS//3329544108//2392//frame0